MESPYPEGKRVFPKLHYLSIWEALVFTKAITKVRDLKVSKDLIWKKEEKRAKTCEKKNATKAI